MEREILKKSKLLESLEIVKPGLSSREFLEQSTSFAFLPGYVATFNDEISVRHPIDLDISGAVQAEELYGILTKLGSEEVALTMKDRELLISCGKFKAGISVEPEILLPLHDIPMEENGAGRHLPEDFIKALSFVKFSASRDLSTPVLTCIYVHDHYMDSSDNFRITRYRMQEAVDSSFLIPASVVDVLSRYTFSEIMVMDSWVHFSNSKGTIFSVRTFDADFPDIPRKLDIYGTQVGLPRKLVDMLERASVVVKKDTRLDEEVLVRIEENEFIICGQGDVGWTEERANIKYKGDPISFRIAPEFLKNMAQIRHCTIGQNIIKFQGENWEHVIALKSGGGE